MSDARLKLFGMALVVAAAACWASSGLWVHHILAGSSLSAIGMAFWRDLSTALLLFAGLGLFRPAWLRVKRRDLPWLALMGAISIGIFHAMWNASVLINGVGVATVLQYNGPMVVAVLAWFVWREPLTGRKLAAILVAFAGTVLVAGLSGASVMQISGEGLLMGLGTAVTFSGLSIVGKKLGGDYNPVTILAYAFGFGALALLPLTIWQQGFGGFDVRVAGWFAGLIVVATLGGFSLYTFALRLLPASVAAIIAAVEVPFAALMSFVLLGERLDLMQIMGAGLVVGGVLMVSAPQGKRRLRLRRAFR